MRGGRAPLPRPERPLGVEQLGADQGVEQALLLRHLADPQAAGTAHVAPDRRDQAVPLGGLRQRPAGVVVERPQALREGRQRAGLEVLVVLGRLGPYAPLLPSGGALGAAGLLILLGLIGRGARFDPALGVAVLAFAVLVILFPFQLLGSAHADSRVWPVIFMTALIAIQIDAVVSSARRRGSPSAPWL